MLPKLNCTIRKDPSQGDTKTEVDIIVNETIDSIKARQLSHNKIKSYSLENKIKILLFNSKLFFVSLSYTGLYLT